MVFIYYFFVKEICFAKVKLNKFKEICGKEERGSLESRPLMYFFLRFGRHGTKLRLKMMRFPSKDLKVLLFVFFGWRRNCS